MRAIIVLAGIFIFIVVSVISNISVLYPLAAGLILTGTAAMLQGYGFMDILKMCRGGMKKLTLIFKIFALIGIVISIWMASGTVPGLMYYGFLIIHPRTVVVVAFILSSIVSMLLGTSFGTVSTIGVALMAVGRGFGISPGILAGAIISGAYLGDRSSPMSSSAVLTASVTDSPLYKNLKHMVSTLLPALVISLVLYLLTGVSPDTQSYDMSGIIQLQQYIESNFCISPVVLIPPLIILILPLFKIDIKINMLVGIIIGCAISLILQKYSITDLLHYSIYGYDRQFPNNLLSDILKGGGLLSMAKAAITIAVSSALNGIFEGTGMLKGVLSFFIRKVKSEGHLVLKTSVLGLVTAMYGCSQTLSIMLTGYIMKSAYRNKKISPSSFARTLADTCVVLSPLVPWNIAGLVPAANLGVRVIDYIPYAYFCLILPVITILYSYTGHIKRLKYGQTD